MWMSHSTELGWADTALGKYDSMEYVTSWPLLFSQLFFCQLYTIDTFLASSTRRLYTAQTTVQRLAQLQHVSSLIYPERLG